MTKEYVLGVTDYSKATWGQNFIASIAGAVASITVAAPLDTVKTRIQNANFEQKVPGVVVVKELLKNEGPTAFFKGLTPKVGSYPRAVGCGTDTICLLDSRRGAETGLQLYASPILDTVVF